MKLVKEMLSVRVDPLVKAAVKADAKASGETESEVITKWVLQSASSPEACKLISERIEGDPLLSAASRLSILLTTRKGATQTTPRKVAAKSVASARKKAGLPPAPKAAKPNERK